MLPADTHHRGQLQDPLQQTLDGRSGPGFQRFPGRHRRDYGFQRRFFRVCLNLQEGNRL